MKDGADIQQALILAMRWINGETVASLSREIGLSATAVNVRIRWGCRLAARAWLRPEDKETVGNFILKNRRFPSICELANQKADKYAKDKRDASNRSFQKSERDVANAVLEEKTMEYLRENSAKIDRFHPKDFIVHRAMLSELKLKGCRFSIRKVDLTRGENNDPSN